MNTYRLSAGTHRTMREKIRAAQTLLNVHLVAELEGRRPPSAAVRLEMAEEAEELVHDVADILDRLEIRERNPTRWHGDLGPRATAPC